MSVVTDKPQSVGRLYAQHKVELVRFATVLVGPSNASDVVSDAMLSLLGGTALGDADHPRALMYRAVLTTARSMQRSGFRRRARERKVAERVGREDPEIRPEILRAVARLSTRQRACVFLTYWEDLPVSDVAQRLGISDGAVKKHLARARSQLREVLDE